MHVQVLDHDDHLDNIRHLPQASSGAVLHVLKGFLNLVGLLDVMHSYGQQGVISLRRQSGP